MVWWWLYSPPTPGGNEMENEKLAARNFTQSAIHIIEQLCPRRPAGVVLEQPEARLDGRDPEPDGEDHPAAGEVVDRHCLPGQLPRPASRQRGEHGPEPDALGPHRGCPEHHPGVDGPDPFPDEEAVPAVLLRECGELGGAARITAGHDEAVLHACDASRPL